MWQPEPQPVKAIIAMKRRRITDLAQRVECSAHHLGRVVNGWERPSPRIRRALAAELQLPEEVLFRADLAVAAS